MKFEYDRVNECVANRHGRGGAAPEIPGWHGRHMHDREGLPGAANSNLVVHFSLLALVFVYIPKICRVADRLLVQVVNSDPRALQRVIGVVVAHRHDVGCAAFHEVPAVDRRLVIVPGPL